MTCMFQRMQIVIRLVWSYPHVRLHVSLSGLKAPRILRRIPAKGRRVAPATPAATTNPVSLPSHSRQRNEFLPPVNSPADLNLLRSLGSQQKIPIRASCRSLLDVRFRPWRSLIIEHFVGTMIFELGANRTQHPVVPARLLHNLNEEDICTPKKMTLRCV